MRTTPMRTECDRKVHGSLCWSKMQSTSPRWPSPSIAFASGFIIADDVPLMVLCQQHVHEVVDLRVGLYKARYKSTSCSPPPPPSPGSRCLPPAFEVVKWGGRTIIRVLTVNLRGGDLSHRQILILLNRWRCIRLNVWNYKFNHLCHL